MKFYRFEKKIDDFEIIQLLSVMRSLRTESSCYFLVKIPDFTPRLEQRSPAALRIAWGCCVHHSAVQHASETARAISYITITLSWTVKRLDPAMTAP